MEIETLEKEGLISTRIIRDNEKLAVLTFSVQVNRSHSPKEMVLRSIFGEALFAGTTGYTRTEFLDALGLLGVTFTTSNDGDIFSITLQALDTTLLRAMQLFEAAFKNPSFSQNEIKRIKIYLRNTLILSKEDARMRAYQNFSSVFTPSQDSHYPFSIDAQIAELQKVTEKDLRLFHADILHSKWYLTSGGTKKTTQSIEKHFLALRKINVHMKNTSEKIFKLIEPKKRNLLFLNLPSKHNIEINIGGYLPLTRLSPDYPAFVFGMSVLALYGGFTGRLMSIVREKEGLTYGIYGQAERLTATQEGFWRIMTFFNPKDVEQGILSTLREIERIKKNGITNAEFCHFKKILHTRAALVGDSLFKKMSEVHGYTLAGQTETSFTLIREKIQALNQKEINVALKKYLNTKTLTISGAGPIAKVEKTLKRFASIKH